MVNKWDLVENKETNTAKELEDKIKERIAPFNDVPIVFISVWKTADFRAIEETLRVYDNRSTRITTSKLNAFVQDIIEAYSTAIIQR